MIDAHLVDLTADGRAPNIYRSQRFVRLPHRSRGAPLAAIPEVGQLVRVRERRYVVTDVRVSRLVLDTPVDFDPPLGRATSHG